MENELIINETALEYSDVQSMAVAYEKVLLWEQTVRAMKARLMERMGASFKDLSMAEIPLSDTRKLIYSREKTEKWKTEQVYDLFSVPVEVRAIIEANPDFRKRALEHYLGSKEEVAKLLNVEYKDTYKIKELDEKFITKRKAP